MFLLVVHVDVKNGESDPVMLSRKEKNATRELLYQAIDADHAILLCAGVLDHRDRISAEEYNETVSLIENKSAELALCVRQLEKICG